MATATSFAKFTCGFMALVFFVLACGILIDPATVQKPHGLDFSKSRPSALAEIRAYYFGTMFVLTIQMAAGATGEKATRRRALLHWRYTRLRKDFRGLALIAAAAKVAVDEPAIEP